VLIRLVPATLAYGTSDVLSWELLGRMLLSGENFYATRLHNWPPLWIYFTAAAALVHDATGLPFSLLVKLPPSAADAFIAVWLYRIGLTSGWRHSQATLAGLSYALNPVSVLITGYHGQFDSLMLAPTLLAWSLFPRRLLGSALALGLGIWFKTVPLLLLPVLLPRLPTWRDRSMYAALSLAPAALGTLPFLLLWPEDVVVNFFGYSSWFGQWGYPVLWMLVEYLRNGTLPWWLPDPGYVSRPLHLMFEAGRWVLLAALAATWWLTYRRAQTTLTSILSVFSVFYIFASGFGVQYLLWIVPFGIAARDRWLWPFTVVATGLLVVAYTLGFAYMPLDVSPDNAPNGREFIVKLASLPTWVVCGLWAWSSLRRHESTPSRS
jgi:uncharacterized membrane protein